MELDGQWRATAVDDRSRRIAIDPDLDDSSWSTIDVPGRLGPDLGRQVMLRRRFELETREHDRRRWVIIERLAGRADLWLDGAYLGDPVARATPHAFEISRLADLGREHTLALEVHGDPDDARSPIGAPAHIGLTGSVRIIESGPVRIDRLRLLCRDADDSRAHLLIRLALDSDRGRQVVITTTVDGVEADRETRTLAQGANRVGWGLDIPAPDLWWPRGLGAQPLVDIGVHITVDGVSSDEATRRTGLRRVAWDGSICSVNGERIFLKGANVLPVDAGDPDLDDTEVAERATGLVSTAVDLGLEALRVHTHVAHHALYEAADQAGLLILQDVALPDTSLRHARGAVNTRARDLIDALGHHPSILCWTPHQVDDGQRWRARPSAGGVVEARLRNLTRNRRPSAGRILLDLWARRSVEQFDPTRSGERLPGVLANLPLFDRSGSHLYLGWNEGETTDLPRLTRRIPAVSRFVGEFGFPTISRSTAERLRDDLDAVRPTLGFDPDTLLERIPPDRHRDLDSWVSAADEQQAEVVRRTVEHLRRLRYQPCGGFTVFCLNDPTPGWGWGLIAADGSPRPSLTALAEACRPIAVIADRLGPELAPGSRHAVDIHVVSDLRYDIAEAEVDVVVTGPDLEIRRRFAGAIDADSSTKVGTVGFRVPETRGQVEVTATVRADGLGNTHRQVSAIQLPLS